MMDTALFDLPTAKPAHPAKYTDALFVTMAHMLKGSKRILDPFGGTGKVFLLNQWLPDAQIDTVEIEAHVAAIDPRITHGDALYLPWTDGTFDAVCTSPTYGNRMADHHNAKDGSKRRTYRHTFGRELHPNNSGALPWGDKYRTFHVAAWTEARRVLQLGGVFVLNIKDHIRGGVVQPVTEWHIGTLQALGFVMVQHEHVSTPSMRYGKNSELRVEYESVIKFVLGA